MAPVIVLRPRRRVRRYIGAALRSVIADVSSVERAMTRLTVGSTVFGIAVGVALQVLA